MTILADLWTKKRYCSSCMKRLEERSFVNDRDVKEYHFAGRCRRRDPIAYWAVACVTHTWEFGINDKRISTSLSSTCVSVVVVVVVEKTCLKGMMHLTQRPSQGESIYWIESHFSIWSSRNREKENFPLLVCRQTLVILSLQFLHFSICRRELSSHLSVKSCCTDTYT